MTHALITDYFLHSIDIYLLDNKENMEIIKMKIISQCTKKTRLALKVLER